MSTTPPLPLPPRPSQPPTWVPGVVADMLPNYRIATEAERAILHRLTHDPRMRRVWLYVAKLTPRGMTPDQAARQLFALAYQTAVEARPVTTLREYREQTIAARSWPAWFTSPVWFDVGPLVAHTPDGDPVAKAMQLTVAGWFGWTYGGPHRGLVATITEVALDCHVSRDAGRVRRKLTPGSKPVRAQGCR